MKLKKFRPAFMLTALLFTVFSLNASSHATGETVNYSVMYKWGLVNKQAGRVRISTRAEAGNTFRSVLTARSERWADRFFKVRDTLIGTMSATTCEPLSYEKITHEGGKYKRDLISYTRSENSTTGHCTRYRQKKAGHPVTSSEITLTARGLTLDMLSAFYYMRSINYNTMKTGEKKVLNVFSGKRKELLTIEYNGVRTIEIDDRRYECYYITFRFTGDGGKKTSDDMDAWISTGADRIPLKLEGKLPVGKVQCFYTGSKT